MILPKVELHPYLQQDVLVRYCQAEGMHVTAYSPMGHGKSYWNDSIASIREKEIIDIAAKHGVTPGQVWFLCSDFRILRTILIKSVHVIFYIMFPNHNFCCIPHFRWF